jgi:hypothetical protein
MEMLEQRFGEWGGPLVMFGKRPRWHGKPFILIIWLGHNDGRIWPEVSNYKG